MSGYLLRDGTDIINFFEPLQNQSGNINSSGSGIQITGSTGPILFQNNNSGNPINLQTTNTTGNIQFLANQKMILSIGATGILINSPARPSLLVNTDGALCYTNFNYGYNYITPITSSTYILTASSPRYLITGNTNSFTLRFPATPANGTTFHIIKTSISGTITLSVTDAAVFRDGTNTAITTTTAPLKATYYAGTWYTVKF